MTIKLDILRVDGFGESKTLMNVTKIENRSDDKAIKFYYTYSDFGQIKEQTQIWGKEQIFKIEILP